MAGTSLEHDPRFVPVVAHRPQRRRIGFVQVDQDVTGIAVLGIRVDVHVTTLALRARRKRMAKLANCAAVQSRSAGNSRLVVLWIRRTR
jgi:hypothetical protein